MKSLCIAKQSMKNAQRCTQEGCTVGKTKEKDVIEIEEQNSERIRLAKMQHT